MKREQCPKCANYGKDRSHDNLAVYPDGSKFCFSCHYMEHSSNITSKLRPIDKLKTNITLPSDIIATIPKEVKEYKDFYE